MLYRLHLLLAITTLTNSKMSLIITARKQSLGQGNIFTGVCQEFFSQGGVCFQWGVSSRGDGCLLWGAVCSWGVSASGGGCLLPRGVVCSRGCLVETYPPRYCCGWYASYWNAFLLLLFFSEGTNFTQEHFTDSQGK